MRNAIQNFGKDKMSAATLDVYKELLGESVAAASHDRESFAA